MTGTCNELWKKEILAHEETKEVAGRRLKQNQDLLVEIAVLHRQYSDLEKNYHELFEVSLLS